MHQGNEVIMGIEVARALCDQVAGRRPDLRWVVRDPQGPAQLEDEAGAVHGYASLDVVRAIPAHQRALAAQREQLHLVHVTHKTAKPKKAKKLGRRDTRRRR